MTQEIELFYDFRSPYGYLAFTQLHEMNVAMSLRPMKILTVLEKVGNVPTTITCAAKGRYARADLARWAGRYGITLNPSNMRDNDGDACSRAVLAAGSPSEADAITLALALFPLPVQLAPNRVAWRTVEVREWVDNRVAA